jgi:DNA-binding beta-propeller fold protein YncE
VFFLALVACGGEQPVADAPPPPDAGPLPATVLIAAGGALVAHDPAGGAVLGRLAGVTGIRDLARLDDTFVLATLGGDGALLLADARRMVETARVPASRTGATGPARIVVGPPATDGRQRVAVLNEGGTSGSIALFDYRSDLGVHALAEVVLAAGRHEAAFSATLPRVVVSSQDDCAAPLVVIDFADAGRVKRVATLDAGGCVLPGGCVAAGAGEAYCLLAGSGELAAVTIDLALPAFTRVSTQGTGSGAIAADASGRWVVAVQARPRGAACAVGQLAVLDTTSDSVAARLALHDCDDPDAVPASAALAPDGRTLFVTRAGAGRALVVDLTDPAAPAELPAIRVPAARATARSPDGTRILVAGDDSVAVIDAAARAAVATWSIAAAPDALCAAGPWP